MNDLILATDWEKVDADEYYLGNDWGKTMYGRLDEVREARKLQKEGKLYRAYVVPAKSLVLYSQMDASEVFINDDADVVLEGESSVIGSDFEHTWEYEL